MHIDAAVDVCVREGGKRREEWTCKFNKHLI